MLKNFDKEQLVSAATTLFVHMLFFVALAATLQGAASISSPPKFIKLRLGESEIVADEVFMEKNSDEIEVQAQAAEPLPEFGEVAEEKAIEPIAKPQKSASSKVEGSKYGNSDTGQKTATYLELLQLTVQETSKIPSEARAAGLSGNAVLRLTFNREGYVRKFKLIQKTGHAVLDEAALDVGAKLSYQPFPPMPDNFEQGRKTATYDFPVSFKP